MKPQAAQLHRRTYDELTPALIDELWTLYSAAYKITRERFIQRLQELDSHALFYLRDQHNTPQLVGIAGIRQRRLDCEGTTINTIYLGQVFIAPHARRHLFIQRLVFKLFLEAKRSAPKAPIMFWVDALSSRSRTPSTLSSRSPRSACVTKAQALATLKRRSIYSKTSTSIPIASP